MKKTKYIVVGIIIGLFVFPTITLGGTFISSLIQGKTVEESVQILATQMDSLIGRVEVLEDKQETLETEQDVLADQQAILEGLQQVLENQQAALGDNQTKETACRKMQDLEKAPYETKIAYYNSSNQPIYADWAPNETEALLQYLNAYIENYNNTGNVAYTHIPDYTPESAQEYIPILQNRLQQYLAQKEICQ